MSKEISAEVLLKLVTDPRFAQVLAGVVAANGARYGGVARPGAYLKETAIVPPRTIADYTIYGRNSLFDPCQTGDIFGLQVETHGIMNWLGWRKNNFWKRTVSYITWWRGEGADEGVGAAGSPCDDPGTWEYGECDYELCHESWYHMEGHPLGPHNIQDRCETSPRYRLDGKIIADDWEWQLNGIMNTLKQSVSRDVVHGSHLNAWEMNGLEAIVRRGHLDNNNDPCTYMDSYLIDWQHDDLDGLVSGWGNFFDFLDELVPQIEYRASRWGSIAETDMVLFTSRFMASCLLNAFACWSVCGATTTNDRTEQALRAQTLAYRQTLNGGPLYDGRKAVGFISLKMGRRIPILVDDAFDITRPSVNYCTDIYLLTRRIGSIDTMYGEYLDLGKYANAMRKFNQATGIRAEQAGRFAFKGKEDNWCGTALAGTSPEIYYNAPWSLARIMNVCCERVLQPVTGDPFQPDYIPGGRPLYPGQSWGMVCTDVPVAGGELTPTT